jgi:hypothetical protein
VCCGEEILSDGFQDCSARIIAMMEPALVVANRQEFEKEE